MAACLVLRFLSFREAGDEEGKGRDGPETTDEPRWVCVGALATAACSSESEDVKTDEPAFPLGEEESRTQTPLRTAPFFLVPVFFLSTRPLVEKSLDRGTRTGGGCDLISFPLNCFRSLFTAAAVSDLVSFSFVIPFVPACLPPLSVFFFLCLEEGCNDSHHGAGLQTLTSGSSGKLRLMSYPCLSNRLLDFNRTEGILKKHLIKRSCNSLVILEVRSQRLSLEHLGCRLRQKKHRTKQRC
mmetsp:Transcript_46454/g.91670  ORF Transcript_46454/g.91670 Transcript_46454/m.91670 type:complete len:241 (-) Transcript_46454:432-1154(-)